MDRSPWREGIEFDRLKTATYDKQANNLCFLYEIHHTCFSVCPN